MSWLLETPWPVVGFGALALALLAVAFYNTRRTGLLAAMGGVIVLVAAGVVVEWLVVTDEEAVENTLYEVAAALETNDLDLVLSHLAPESEDIRGKAQQYLPMFTIEEAHVGGPEVTINRFVNPPTAVVTFTGRLKLKAGESAQPLVHENFVRLFQVRLRQDGDRWLLTGYVDNTTSKEMD